MQDLRQRAGRAARFLLRWKEPRLGRSGRNPELEAAAALVERQYRGKLAAGRKNLVVAALARRGLRIRLLKKRFGEWKDG